MTIRPVGAQLFLRTDRQTDRYDEANSLFSKFCERAYNGLTTLPAAVTTQRLTVKGSVNNDLENVEGSGYVRVLAEVSRYLPGRVKRRQIVCSGIRTRGPEREAG